MITRLSVLSFPSADEMEVEVKNRLSPAPFNIEQQPVA